MQYFYVFYAFYNDMDVLRTYYVIFVITVAITTGVVSRWIRQVILPVDVITRRAAKRRRWTDGAVRRVDAVLTTQAERVTMTAETMIAERVLATEQVAFARRLRRSQRAVALNRPLSDKRSLVV